MIVRIDFFLKFFERATGKFQAPAPIIQPAEVASDTILIPVSEDKLLKNSARKNFLSLLEDFHSDPVSEIRVKAINDLKATPEMFNETLDKDLEGTIFRWRDLLIQNNSEVTNFLVDLNQLLRGENQQLIQRIFSILMDLNLEAFIKAYSKTSDTNCMVAKIFGDPIPNEEKLNEFNEREKSLNTFLASDKIQPREREFANNCLLVVKVEISQLTTPLLPEAQP